MKNWNAYVAKSAKRRRTNRTETLRGNVNTTERKTYLKLGQRMLFSWNQHLPGFRNKAMEDALN